MVPIAEPSEENKKTNRTLVRRFFHQPLIAEMSSATCSISLTCGGAIKACTRPVTKPAPMVGLSEVMGAAIKAASIVSGCPKAIKAPSAESTPLARTHAMAASASCSVLPVMNPATNSAMTIAGINQGSTFENDVFAGITESSSISSVEKSCPSFLRIPGI